MIGYYTSFVEKKSLFILMEHAANGDLSHLVDLRKSFALPTYHICAKYVCIHIYIYVYVYMCVCMFMYIYTYIYVYVYVYVYVPRTLAHASGSRVQGFVFRVST